MVQFGLPHEAVNTAGSEAITFTTLRVPTALGVRLPTIRIGSGSSCHMLREPLWTWTCSLCFSQYHWSVVTTGSEKTHTQVTAFLKDLKCSKQDPSRKN